MRQKIHMSVAIWGVGGTPPPEIFFTKKITKNAIFSHISQKFELIGLQKIGGQSVPLPLGAPPLLPLTFFTF